MNIRPLSRRASSAPVPGERSRSLGQIVASLPCTLFTLRRTADGAFAFTFVSAQSADLLGIEPADLILDPSMLLDRLVHKDAVRLRADIEQAFAKGEPWRTRIDIQVAGALRTLECHGRFTMPALEEASGYLVEAFPSEVSEEQSFLWTSVFEQSADGIVVCGADLLIRLVNPSFERITGYASAEVLGRTPRILQSGRHNAAFYHNMWSAIAHEGRWSGEIWNRRKNGEIYAERLIVHAIRNRCGKVTSYVAVFSDESERKAEEARLQYLAEHDAVTDLPNRGSLKNRLRRLLELADRTGSSLGVLSVDLEGFSTVNDSLGHAAGDELLRIVASRLKQLVRSSDTVARIGADEFVIVLADVQETTDVGTVARKILTALAEPATVRGQVLGLSASIGVCVHPHDGATAEDLMRNASAAMTRAKRAGRHAIEFYTPEMNTRAAEQLRLENELREALDQRQFVLHYQPQIDLGTGKIIGAEALVRWRRPGVGLVAPNVFLPLAQERGLMLPLGRWVIREAARQIAAWDAAGLSNFTVAVNLTATEFHSSAIVEELCAVVREHQLSPSRLELELTESIAVQDIEATRRTLYALHEQGFQLSLDDFGTGYSSLSYLRQFPIDKVKIDRSFVSEMTTAPGAIRIVRAIISLAKSFEMKVIAEGVETEEQLRALRAEHCDLFQGFFASAALPADEFGQLLREWNLPSRKIQPWCASCPMRQDTAAAVTK